MDINSETQRVVLLVDIVESTRLFENHEQSFIYKWRKFVDVVESMILPELNGTFVKSTGDGFLLAFVDCKDAARAAFRIQAANATANAEGPETIHCFLRISMEISDVVMDRHDMYGRGVILAKRLLEIAGPGEIVVSANVRDHLTYLLDADIEDLGDCFVKHYDQPLRAYRIGPAGPKPIIENGYGVGNLFPTIAVIPFADRGTNKNSLSVGEVIADELITTLSKSSFLNVISRLSTTAFRNRNLDYDGIKQYLNADYVLSGSYGVNGDKLQLIAELSETDTGKVIWSEHMHDRLQSLFSTNPDIINRIIAEIGKSVVKTELQEAQSSPLASLNSYTLLISAVNLMHRLSKNSFEEAKEMLQTLVNRATRQSVPHAWLANWYVLRVQQGWSDSPNKDAQLALDCTKKALDADPYSSLSHTIHGFVQTNLFKDIETGRECYELALENNPNEALAWLLKGTSHAFEGAGEQAIEDTGQALRLTPLDPLRFFYESLASTAYLAANRYDISCDLAKRSIRSNRSHTSTLRVLAASQWQLGLYDEARSTAKRLMTLEPDLTVERWLARSPSAKHSIGSEWANILRQVGIPD